MAEAHIGERGVGSVGIVVRVVSEVGIVGRAEGGSEVVRGEERGEDTAGKVGVKVEVGTEAGKEVHIGVVSGAVGVFFYFVRLGSDVSFGRLQGREGRVAWGW